MTEKNATSYWPVAGEERTLYTTGKTCGNCRGGNVEVDPVSLGWRLLPDGTWLVKGGGVHRFPPGAPELVLRPCACQSNGQEG